MLEDVSLSVLGAALAPAHLRVGGTQEDYMLYTGFGGLGGINVTCSSLPAPMTDYRCRELTVSDWQGLLGWVRNNGLTLVYGLNDCNDCCA